MGQHGFALRARERADLVTTLRQVGPDAPTLCAGWSAADIAAHLAISEQALGIPMFVFNGVRRVLPGRVTRWAIERAQPAGDRMIERMKQRGFPALVNRLESGPPRLYRFGSIAHLRTVEDWIHHEDVRRGSGLPPREMDPAFEALLWHAGVQVAKFPEFQMGREGMELDAGNGRRFVVGDPASARVRVTGATSELLLYLAGRVEAADVSVEGDDAAVRTLEPNLRV